MAEFAGRVWKVGLGECEGVESGAWRVRGCGKWGLESVRVWKVEFGGCGMWGLECVRVWKVGLRVCGKWGLESVRVWKVGLGVGRSSQILNSKQCNPLICDIKEGHKASTQTKFH